MKHIQVEVTRLIDNNIAIRKLLKEDLINVRALARKFLEEYSLKCSIEAVISAIRRYDKGSKERDYLPTIYKMLKKAKLSTRMKLSSILLKKSQFVREKLPKLFSIVDFEGGDTLRIFEVSKYIKVIIEEKLLASVKKIFRDSDVVLIENNLSELDILYDVDITKTPGVFATLSNELAANNISIVDSMICYNEHIIIVLEKDTQHAFNVLFGLIHKN